MRSKMLSVVGLLAVLSLMLPACAPTPEVVRETVEVTVPVEVVATPTPLPVEKKPTELTILIRQIPTTPNVALEVAMEATVVYGQMYDTLVGVREGKPVGILAQSWEAIDDTTWQLKLRDGVKFQCGEDFDAEDVKFSIEWNLDPNVESKWKGRLGDIESVEVVDRLTVNIHTKQPSARVIPNLAFLPGIYPSEYFQKVGLDGFVAAPCGTGPFKMVEWVPEEYYVLEAFDDHWRGRPKIDRLVVKKVPEEAARIASLEAGEAQLIYDMSPEEAARLKAAGYQVEVSHKGRVLLMNFRATLDTPFKDKRVRQAANYCVNVEELNETIMGGTGRIISQLVGPDAFGYNPNVKPYAFDPEKGRQLLGEAGYPDGFEASAAAGGLEYKDIELTEAIAAQLESNCGIKVNIEVMDTSAFLDRYLAGTLPEMNPVGWIYAPALDADVSAIWFMSPEIHLRKNTYLDKKELNDLFLEQARTLDSEKRLELLQEMEAMLHDEAVGIFLWQTPNITAFTSNLKNILFRPDMGVELIETTLE